MRNKSKKQIMRELRAENDELRRQRNQLATIVKRTLPDSPDHKIFETKFTMVGDKGEGEANRQIFQHYASKSTQELLENVKDAILKMEFDKREGSAPGIVEYGLKIGVWKL